MKTLYEQLFQYKNSDYYGFHMPGHKRNEKRFPAELPYGLDITEIEGFDDLHHAEGILKKAEERASRLYHSDETHFLVNGSTVGILSAILGCTNKGDKILIGRNCHKSVYHAMFLNELEPVYVYPEYEKEIQINGAVSIEDIKKALEENEDIKAVMLVSPTYDGVLSDIRAIADLVHGYKIPLIIDEAHGAHFGFHPYFPQNANQKGADVVIHSVHKTLPSLTQTALIHLNGELIRKEKIRNYLHMLQSSSPSYILMASIDYCMELLEEKREELFDSYVEDIKTLREDLKGLKHLKIVETGEYDHSKFVISVKDTTLSSKELSAVLLEKYHLQMEMTAGSYVLAMTTVGDTKEGLERLRQALFEIDEMTESKKEESVPFELPKLTTEFTSAKVDQLIQRDGISYLPWKEAQGHVAAEYAYIYPPGIPFIVPGEKITEEVVTYLNKYEQSGFVIEGISVEKQIGVWKNG